MASFFVNRPIVAIVISIIMTIVGIATFLGLPVAQFPNIVPPEIQVKTTYTGADALTVEQSVATPIEQQMSGVDNMNYMSSVNGNDGTLKLTVNFDVTTDPSTDQILSQMRSNQASSQLPEDVNKFGVTVQKSTSSPLIMFSLYSPKGTYDSIFLANYANINLNDEFTRVPGIASVTIFGAGQYAMRIWVKPDTLAKLGVTIPEILQAIRSQNTVNPAGTVGGEPLPEGQEFTYAMRAQGRLQSAEEFGEIVVPTKPRRLHVAGERCGTHRARRAKLRDHRPAQRQARRDRFSLPAPRLECARRCGGSEEENERTVRALPGGPRIRRLARYDTRSY